MRFIVDIFNALGFMMCVNTAQYSTRFMCQLQEQNAITEALMIVR